MALLRLNRITVTCLAMVLLGPVGLSRADVQPELVVQTGHTQWVSSVAVSPTGTMAASGGYGGVVKLWDFKTQKELRQFQIGESGPEAVVFSHDGTAIAAAGHFTVTIWDVSSGRETRKISNGGRRIGTIAFHPSKPILAIATNDWDPDIVLWNVKNSTEIGRLKGHRSSGILALAFTQGGAMLISGGDDKTIRIWRMEDGQLAGTLEGHQDSVESLAVTPDGHYLVSGSRDGTVRLWSLKQMMPVRTLAEHHGHVYSVVVNHSGALLASAGSNNNIELRDLASGTLKQTLSGHVSFVKSVAFSMDDRIILSGSGDNTVKLWDSMSGRLIGSLDGASPVTSVAFSATPGRLATSHYDGTVKFWNLATGKLDWMNQWKTPLGGGASVRAFAQSPDGKQVVASTRSNGAAWTRDGRLVAVFATDGRARIQILDGITGAEIRTIEGSSPVAFSHDGSLIAYADWPTHIIRLIDLRTGNDILGLKEYDPQSSLSAFAFSPDGRFLASATSVNDPRIILWDLKERSATRIFPGLANALAFSPDGTSLAVASGTTLTSAQSNNGVVVWDTDSGHKRFEQRGHAGVVNGVSFSPDGRLLASVSDDATIKIWDANSGAEVVTIVAVGTADYVMVTPDHYYTASRDAYQAVGFRVGTKLFPFEQFDLKLNRPDIVLKRLGYAKDDLVRALDRGYRKRLARAKFTEEMLQGDFHLPEVSITTDKLPLVTSQRAVRIPILARDSKHKLDRLMVYVNDVPVEDNALKVRTQSVLAINREITVQLSSGLNKIQVSVLNEKGVESLRDSVTIRYEGEDSPPDLYLLAIGVSQYADTAYNLKYAAKDAQDITGLWDDRDGRFGNVYVLSILDEKATRTGILEAKSFLQRSRIDDHVVVFLAGHGLLSKSLDYYFATTDVDFLHPEKNGLDYQELVGLLDGLQARKKLLLMDTCHAGELDEEQRAGLQVTAVSEGSIVPRPIGPRGAQRLQGDTATLGLENGGNVMREFFGDLRRGTGTTVIASASGAEFAFEGDKWGNGVFTHAVVQGLRQWSADLNRDGKVTVSELSKFVTEVVAELTRGAQTPSARQENIENDFRVY